jgi:uncharacterized protein YbaR (Trm112 family)
MGLALMGITAPLGHTQGVETSIGKCPPGTPTWDQSRVDVKNYDRQKLTLPNSPATEPVRALGQCAASSDDGACIDNKDNDEAAVCPKCGKAFPIHGGI